MKKDGFAGRLSAYKDGELDALPRGEISSHLGECEACRTRLSEMERVDALIRKMPGIDPGECFSLQVMSRVFSGEQVSPKSARGYGRIVRQVLAFLLSIFDQVFAEGEGTAVLDEFDDFPPLSLSHAYFGAACLGR